jgi:hypothetical protein
VGVVAPWPLTWDAPATAAREEQIPEYRAELGASLGKIKEKNKTNKKPKKKATGAAKKAAAAANARE